MATCFRVVFTWFQLLTLPTDCFPHFGLLCKAGMALSITGQFQEQGGVCRKLWAPCRHRASAQPPLWRVPSHVTVTLERAHSASNHPLLKRWLPVILGACKLLEVICKSSSACAVLYLLRFHQILRKVMNPHSTRWLVYKENPVPTHQFQITDLLSGFHLKAACV